MTPAQAAELLAIAATADRRTVGEAEARFWAKALNGLNLADCAEAVGNHYARTAEWLMPAHVRAEVARIRAERISAAGNADPEYDRDDVRGGLAAIRAQRKAIADGAPGPARLAIDKAGQDRLKEELEPVAASMSRAALRPSPGYLAASRALAARQRAESGSGAS